MHSLDTDVAYSTPSGLKIQRQQPAIGAEIFGADLTKPVPPAVAEDIRQALWAHGVIFFRNQPIDYKGHIALAKMFGEPLEEGLDKEKPELAVFKSGLDKDHDAAGHWHSDGSFVEEPPLMSILRSVKVPALGGDTCFSSAVMAYRNLPDDVKKRIAPLRAVASFEYAASHAPADTVDQAKLKYALAKYHDMEQPIVRIHPITKQPALYVNQGHTRSIVGMDPEEGRALLHYLTSQFTRPEYQMRWKWTDNAVAVWDNAAVQHYAIPDQTGFRHVERIRVAGPRVVGISDIAA